MGRIKYTEYRHNTRKSILQLRKLLIKFDGSIKKGSSLYYHWIDASSLLLCAYVESYIIEIIDEYIVPHCILDTKYGPYIENTQKHKKTYRRHLLWFIDVDSIYGLGSLYKEFSNLYDVRTNIMHHNSKSTHSETFVSLIKKCDNFIKFISIIDKELTRKFI